MLVDRGEEREDRAWGEEQALIAVEPDDGAGKAEVET
jgi:hypothetical protein